MLACRLVRSYVGLMGTMAVAAGSTFNLHLFEKFDWADQKDLLLGLALLLPLQVGAWFGPPRSKTWCLPLLSSGVERVASCMRHAPQPGLQASSMEPARAARNNNTTVRAGGERGDHAA